VCLERERERERETERERERERESARARERERTPLKVGRQGGSEVIIDGGAAQLIGVRCHQPLSFVVHEDLAEIGGGAHDVQGNINITSHSSDRGG
jgi:hypothetical protein